MDIDHSVKHFIYLGYTIIIKPSDSILKYPLPVFQSEGEIGVGARNGQKSSLHP